MIAALVLSTVLIVSAADVRVIDGDTIAPTVCDEAVCEEWSIRLARIDAPETRWAPSRGHPPECEVVAGVLARTELRRLIDIGRTVHIEFDHVGYFGRPIAEVTVGGFGGLNASDWLFHAGYARDYRPGDKREWC